jgi:hypothetical protein
MSSFSDFMKAKLAKPPAEVSIVNRIAALTKSGLVQSNLSLSAETIDPLANQAAEIVTTDAFIKQLGDTITGVKPGESEEEFLICAKAAFRLTLRKRLDDLSVKSVILHGRQIATPPKLSE